MQPVVVVDNATVTLRRTRALQRLSLTIRTGEHLALLGPNGAGKSTLLRLVRGELRPDADGGTVTWFPGGLPETSPLAGRQMTAPVSVALLDKYETRGWRITAEEVLLSGIADTDMLYDAPPEGERLAALALARDSGLGGLLQSPISRLSRGQLSLMLLARGIVRKPALLLLDEFTNGMDRPTRDRVLDILERAATETTIVMATHRLESLPACVCREVRMEEGRILFDVPRRPEKRTAHLAPDLLPLPEERDALPALVELRGATAYVQRVRVLEDISWTMRRGEHWAVLGSNGSGKSTFLHLLAGDLYPAAGGLVRRFAPDGREEIRGLAAIRKGVRLLSDRLQATYAYNLTGLELVLSGFDGSIGLYRDHDGDEQAEALRWMEVTGSRAFSEVPIRSLSTGQMRRLLLARALVGAPHLLLLDDPFAGLDQASCRQMRDTLEELMRRGVHLVMATHHEQDLPAGIRHVLRLEGGRAVAAGLRAAAPAHRP